MGTRKIRAIKEYKERRGRGRPFQYGEKTTLIGFRIPDTNIENEKKMVKKYLEDEYYAIQTK